MNDTTRRNVPRICAMLLSMSGWRYDEAVGMNQLIAGGKLYLCIAVDPHSVMDDKVGLHSEGTKRGTVQ